MLFLHTHTHTHTHTLPHFIRRPTTVYPDGTTAGGAAQIGYRDGPCYARGRRHMQGHTASDYGADQVSVRRLPCRGIVYHSFLSFVWSFSSSLYMPVSPTLSSLSPALKTRVCAPFSLSRYLSLRLPSCSLCSRCSLRFGDRLYDRLYEHYEQLYVQTRYDRFVQQVSATASMKARGISANPAHSSHNTSRGLAGGYGYGASPASVAVTVRSRDRDEKRV